MGAAYWSVFPSTDSRAQPLGARPAPGSVAFVTTRWNLVLAAGGDSPEGMAALDQLCRVYWYPLYAYVRRCGYGPHDAQDLTQAFFADVFRKNYFRAADRDRGKFRSFLLTSLRHFLAHEWKKARAEKRGGGLPLVNLEELGAETLFQEEPATAGTPERLYDRTWALRVFEHGLAQLCQESAAQGKNRQFERLKDFLTEEPGPGAYDAVAASLDLSPNAVAVAVHRLRQRYAALVREAVAETVAQPAQVEDELRYLISLICG